MGRSITVNDRMQRKYRYELTAPVARNFDPEFRPQLTPAEMLRLGVFGGKYMTDCRDEFPPAWFKGAKLAGGRRDSSLNYFGVNASQPLSEWRRKGWIHRDDPRGWFQWYCRYHIHEHVPTQHLHALEDSGVAVRPGPEALVHAQDKGVMRARLAEARSRARATRWSSRWPTSRRLVSPCVLKTTRGGYDGKGVWFVLVGRRVHRTLLGSRRRAAYACWPRSESTSGGKPRRWLSVPRAGRPRRTPWWPRRRVDGICREVIAPATGPGVRPGSVGHRRSRCGSLVLST